MDNNTMYNLFLSTLSKLSDNEIEQTLTKAKGLLSESDYLKLYELIQKEKGLK